MTAHGSLFKLFGVPFWHIKAKDNFNAEELIQEAHDIQAKDKKRIVSNRGGWQSGFLEQPDCPLAWEYIRSCLESADGIPLRHKIDQGWLNINKSGHYNVVHTHGDGRLACVFYLTDGHRKLGILNTLCTDQAHLQILDEGECFYPICEAGDLIMFPSKLPHWVESHSEETERITYAFNISFLEIGAPENKKLRENVHVR
tara:strand:- start:106 stop:705 length:600 start_codon:yes stop_codon:yes gene_type:complete